MIHPHDLIEAAVCAMDKGDSAGAHSFVAEARQHLSWERIRQLLEGFSRGNSRDYSLLLPPDMRTM